MTDLEKRVEELNIRINIKPGGNTKPCEWDTPIDQVLGYRVILRRVLSRNGNRRKEKRITTDFFTGLRVKEFGAADVLACLLSDAYSALESKSFENWCEVNTYDIRSRRSKRIHDKCWYIADRLENFLGRKLMDELSRLEH